MKHLLIFFIPTFHLCLFVTSCEKKDKMLYGWITSSGWEWKKTGDKNDNPLYNGQVKREYIILGDYIREGQGDLTYPDGRRFVGKWKDDKKNGQGTLTSPDGDKFVGEYKDDNRHGQGTFTSYNGEKYVGTYKDNRRNGHGTYTSPDGVRYVGEWNGGQPWNGKVYLKKGNIIRIIVNGEEEL